MTSIRNNIFGDPFDYQDPYGGRRNFVHLMALVCFHVTSYRLDASLIQLVTGIQYVALSRHESRNFRILSVSGYGNRYRVGASFFLGQRYHVYHTDFAE